MITPELIEDEPILSDFEENNSNLSERQVYTANADGVSITAKVGAESEIPDGAKLYAEKLDEDSAKYDIAMSEARRGLSVSDEEELYFVPYDIFFLSDGKRIEPNAGSIDVTMSFDEDPFAGISLESSEDGEDDRLERALVHVLSDGSVERSKQSSHSKTDFSFEVTSFSVMGPALVKPIAGGTTYYAILYEDGEMVFQDTDAPGESKAVRETFSLLDTDRFNDWTSVRPWKSCLEDIISVRFETTASPIYLYYMFYNCTNLVSVDFGNINTINVLSMDYMFYNCSSLLSVDFNGADIKSSCCYMFYNCISLQSFDFNTANSFLVSDTRHMFENCQNLGSIDLTNFNFFDSSGSGVYADGMFKGCTNLLSIDFSGVDCSSVSSISEMFYGCKTLDYADLSMFTNESLSSDTEHVDSKWGEDRYGATSAIFFDSGVRKIVVSANFKFFPSTVYGIWKKEGIEQEYWSNCLREVDDTEGTWIRTDDEDPYSESGHVFSIHGSSDGDLIIAKHVESSNEADMNREFHFRLRIVDPNYIDRISSSDHPYIYYKIYDSKMYGNIAYEQDFYSSNNGLIDFTLKDDQVVNFFFNDYVTDRLDGYCRLYEEEEDAGEFIVSISEGLLKGDPGSAAFSNSYPIITNTKAPSGNLSVTKTVTGNDGDKQEGWPFNVTLSNTAINGTYGADEATNMTFVNGVAEFTLHDGETRTADGLPTGITYTVTETTDDGYLLTKTGDTGTIPEGDTAQATFTNTKSKPYKEETSPGAGEGVRTGDEITYKITYENATPDPLDIKITDKLDPGLDFVSATDGGVYDVATHTVTWTLNAVAANSLNQEVSLTVRVNAQAQTKVENSANVQFGTLPEITTEKITNPVVGDLSVTKTVTGNAGDVNADWQFTVTLNDTSINGVYGADENSGMNFSNGTASFSLKNGQTRTATDLPAGITYTVTEQTQDGYLVTKTGDTGSIQNGVMAKASFTNTKSEPHKTEDTPGAGKGKGVYLEDQITYKITYENATPTPLNIIITDRLDDGLDFVAASDGGVYDAASHTVTWTLNDVPENSLNKFVTLTVKVNSKAVKQVENTASVQFGALPAVSTETITNPLLGNLSVTKTVTGNDSDPAKEWTFNVTLSDATVNGVYGDDAETGMSFTDGSAQFTLHSGETRTAKRLPSGITYTVTETTDEGYILTKSGDTGTIPDNSTAEAKFTNTKSKPHKEEVTPGAGEGVRTGDEIVYKIKYENATPDVMDITIKDRLDEGLDFVSADNGGTYDSGTRTVTWSLKGVAANTLDQSVTLTVRVNDSASTKVDNTATVEFDSQPEISTETITNPVVGDLSVTKTVTGNAAEEGKAFFFQVTLSDTGISGLYGADDATGMNFSNGTASFTLTNGQTRTATDLPAGITYTVTEQTEEGYLLIKTGETGSIQNGVMAQATFTNTKSEPHKTEETPGADEDVRVGEQITYQISYENATPNPLKIVITDTLDEGLDFVSATDGGVYDEASRTVTWMFDSVPAGSLDKHVSLTVKVNEHAVKKVANTAEVQFGDLPAVSTETIENPVVGDLSVTKNVTGSQGDTARDWHFTVTLSDTTVNGVFGDDDVTGMTFVNGVAEFTLKHGETRTAKGLPSGVSYTVTEQEENQDLYITTKENDTGEISPLEETKVTFTNEKRAFLTLPSTGGMGTGWIMLVSLLLCLTGCLIIFKRNRFRSR